MRPAGHNPGRRLAAAGCCPPGVWRRGAALLAFGGAARLAGCGAVGAVACRRGSRWRWSAPRRGRWLGAARARSGPRWAWRAAVVSSASRLPGAAWWCCHGAVRRLRGRLAVVVFRAAARGGFVAAAVGMAAWGRRGGWSWGCWCSCRHGAGRCRPSSVGCLCAVRSSGEDRRFLGLNSGGQMGVGSGGSCGCPSAVAAGRVRSALLAISRAVVMIRTATVLVGASGSLGVAVCGGLGSVAQFRRLQRRTFSWAVVG